MEGGCPETAVLSGRNCDICQVECEDRVCAYMHHKFSIVLKKLSNIQSMGSHSLPVISSLQTWGREIPTWNVVDGLSELY